MQGRQGRKNHGLHSFVRSFGEKNAPDTPFLPPSLLWPRPQRDKERDHCAVSCVNAIIAMPSV